MSDMRLLMLSSDAKIFEEGSRVGARMAQYGTIVGELTIVVIAGGERREKFLAPNVRVVQSGGKNKSNIFFNARRLLREIATSTSFDLVSVQDPFFIGMLGYGIAKARHIPLQVQLHTDCFSFGFLMESPRRIFEALIAIFILSRAQCIRVVSERIAKSVRKITKIPVTVLPIHTEYTPLMRNESERGSHTLKLVSVSRLTKEKRMHLIIDAVAITPGVELTIVGDGPLRKSLELRVQSLELKERVRFVGWQDPAEYYAGADVLVHASQYEGYGAVLVEAALSELAIITTDVGVVGEVLENEKSALVVAGNKRAIGYAINRLVTDSKLRIRLASRAKEAASQNVISFEEYLACYQSALSQCSI